MNSSEWDKFRKQQATEREQLQRLLSGIHGLLAKCRTTAPTEIELSALAANGSYELSLADVNAYNPSGGWAITGGSSSGVFYSDNGSHWNSISMAYPQFAINATPVPEPSLSWLLFISGVVWTYLRGRIHQSA